MRHNVNALQHVIHNRYAQAKRGGFIYKAPDPAVSDFGCSPVLFTKEFWAEAAPPRNPELRQVITDLYDKPHGDPRAGRTVQG